MRVKPSDVATVEMTCGPQVAGHDDLQATSACSGMECRLWQDPSLQKSNYGLARWLKWVRPALQWLRDRPTTQMPFPRLPALESVTMSLPCPSSLNSLMLTVIAATKVPHLSAESATLKSIETDDQTVQLRPIRNSLRRIDALMSPAPDSPEVIRGIVDEVQPDLANFGRQLEWLAGPSAYRCSRSSCRPPVVPAKSSTVCFLVPISASACLWRPRSTGSRHSSAR